MTLKVLKADGMLPLSQEDRVTLEKIGATLVERECLTEDALIEAARDADALLILREPVTARVVGALGQCRIISRFGVGVDTIDIGAATQADIIVANVPDANVDEVSTHALAMTLSLLRRLPQYDASVRAGEWRALAVGEGMRRTSDLTFGLVGFGRIGQLVCKKAAAFGFQIQVFDPHLSAADISSLGADPVTFEMLLRSADIVSLHVPLTSETRNIIGEAALSSMKPGAILVNVSRGGLVDEEALAEALFSRRIGAAALDCFEAEPPSNDSPLLRAPNVILSPHAAHYSTTSIKECVSKAVENITDFFQGRTPRSVVTTAASA